MRGVLYSFSGFLMMFFRIYDKLEVLILEICQWASKAISDRKNGRLRIIDFNQA
jgi:hypothetical protein